MKNQFKIFVAIFICGIVNSCNSQDHPVVEEVKNQKIKWMNFEEAVAKGDKEPKKLFIDVYTGWCGWCKKMDATTFQEDSIANYINKNYYAVKLNAETKDTIHFHGTNFIFKPEYKTNELALSLLNGKMGYPTYVFLDEKFNMLAPVSGYMPSQNLMPILKFYTEEIYKTKSWDDYQKEVFKQ